MGFGRRNTAAAEITPTVVRAIRRRYAQGETQRKLGLEFGLTAVHIGRIVRRECWQNVEEEAPAEPQAPRATEPPPTFDSTLARLLAEQEAVNRGQSPLEEGNEK